MRHFTQDLAELQKPQQLSPPQPGEEWVQGPVIATAIPFDQPNPEDAAVLKELAMHLNGIRQVRF